jgi:acyl-CoA reductase-like NAD-dependent aldehyde dehydrogenase
MDTHTGGDHAAHWIGGEWIAAAAAQRSPCYDPATGEVVATLPEGGAAEARAAIGAARHAFETTAWAHAPRQRAALLLAFADRLEARAAEVARWLSLTSGKLPQESMGEVGAGISELRYYAGLARNIFGRHTQIDEGKYSLLSREAAGVAAIIVPWNAPVTLLIRSLAPALAAGCTVVIKPAHQTAVVNDLVLQSLAECPGLPPGVVNSVHESGAEAGTVLTTHPQVDLVSFTGSPATAKRIMAAGAGTLKRFSLELGGKAPCLVFADADIPTAVAGITAGALAVAGQMCTSATRVLVQDSVAAPLREGLTVAFQNMAVGPPTDPAARMGPLIDRRNRDRVAEAVEGARVEGEVIVPGGIPGNVPPGGAFLRPALIAVQDLQSRYVQEELFGPVLNLEVVPDEATAVARANATRYGLAASVWTRDLHRASRVSRALRSGTVWVNCHNRLFAEAETGGWRESGFGRLHGLEGLGEFLQTKHVYHEDPPVPRPEPAPTEEQQG